MKKKFISILLCLCMVLMLCPVTALADEPVPVTKIEASFEIPVVGCGAWIGGSYSSEPKSEDKDVIRLSFNWYRILKSNCTGEESDVWEIMSPAKDVFTEGYYYKAVCPIEIRSEYREKYIIRNDVNATINGQICNIQVADDGKSGVMVSSIFEARSSIAATIDEPAMGKTPDFSLEITTLPENSVKQWKLNWFKCPKGSDQWVEMESGEKFTEGYSYSVVIKLYANDGFSFDENTLFTVNEDSVYSLTISPKEAEFEVIFDPFLSLTVPFTTTVKLGGDTAPGKTVFELELVDNRGEKLGFDGVEVSASVTTNGAGNYEGYMTFIGAEWQLQNMLWRGAFVKQVDAGKPNWTYDDTVWGLYLWNVAELAANDTAAEYSVFIFPTGFEEDGNGGRYYYLDFDKGSLERMSFINTYTYSAPTHNTTTIVISGDNKPAEQNPNTGAPVAANMSMLSVLTIAAAAAAVLKMKKH